MARMESQPTVALVGNSVPGPNDPDRSAEIDGHEDVWRFNNAPGMAGGKQGTRTTLLWLVNSGGSMRERLEMGEAFTSMPCMGSTRALAFPVHPSILRRYHPEPSPEDAARGNRNDWTDIALDRFGAGGWDVTVLGAPHYLRACAAIGLNGKEMRERFPSTGFLAAHWLLETRPGIGARVYGFTWAGWDNHAWDAEAEWFAAREREGRLRVVRQEGG